MTTLTRTPSTTITTGTVAGIGAATCAVALTLTTLFAHDWAEVATVAPVIVVAGAIVYGLVVPRALRRDSQGGAALVLAVLAALVVVPAFWSGLPLVLGVAAMVLGNAGRRSREGAGTAIAGLVLSTLAVLFYGWIYVSEGLQGMAGLPG
ncbi:hypothetical protein [Nocardioides coralli]|uniref:hypothetical protein n=1 Tax=Nocardioides coralli TaxID=2872154 RepID=UPI001CA45B74|nr:hypothetical protein [Nocardioides coralli]QZY29667.1 hypothetical protein K6T13_02960 [Nocardioides coralli]